MMDQLEELPLFPLNAVLLPFARMPIHVFEPRYQELIRNCLRSETGFGVCLIKSGNEVGGNAEPYLVGTACRIISVQTHADNTMDVQIEGKRRFRVRKLDEDSFPYLVGHVESIQEEEVDDENRLHALAAKTRELTTSLISHALEHANMQISQIRLPEDAYALSFVVAEFLTLENIERQRLLEYTDTAERLVELIPIITSHLDANTEPHYSNISLEEMSEWITPN